MHIFSEFGSSIKVMVQAAGEHFDCLWFRWVWMLFLIFFLNHRQAFGQSSTAPRGLPSARWNGHRSPTSRGRPKSICLAPSEWPRLFSPTWGRLEASSKSHALVHLIRCILIQIESHNDNTQLSVNSFYYFKPSN